MGSDRKAFFSRKTPSPSSDVGSSNPGRFQESSKTSDGTSTHAACRGLAVNGGTIVHSAEAQKPLVIFAFQPVTPEYYLINASGGRRVVAREEDRCAQLS